MPTLRDHLAAQEDAGRGGGHGGGGHHGGGHHHGGHGRGRGGVVFYDRSPDVIVVEDDCPPGFYYDDFGNCRPLPYHSQNVGALGRRRSRAPAPTPERAYTVDQSAWMAAQRTEEESKAREAWFASRRGHDVGHFDSRMRPLPCPESGELVDMMPQGQAFDMRRAIFDAGRVLPRFVTNSDVHDLKMRLNPYVVALDTVVAGCPDMPAAVRDGWESFSQSWKTFFQQGEGFWTAGAEMDQAEAYQADLQTWQAKIASTTCKIDPVTKKPTGVPKDILPPPPSTEGETDKGVSDLSATAKTIAWVAVILAGLYYADKAGVFSASSAALARHAAK